MILRVSSKFGTVVAKELETVNLHDLEEPEASADAELKE